LETGCPPRRISAGEISPRQSHGGNVKRVSTEAVSAKRRIAVFFDETRSVGGCASAGFAKACEETAAFGLTMLTILSEVEG